MFDAISNLFAALQAFVFERAVLPLLQAMGYGGWAEQAFDWTEVFLIGVVEISLLVVVLGALERWRPVELYTDKASRRVDIIYTLINRLGFVPLVLFFLLTPFIDALNAWLRMSDIIPPKLEDALPWLNNEPLLSFVFYLLLIDFIGYWLHRAQHKFNWWWALHALHHSQREMTFWSDNRNHLLDVVLTDAVFALVALAIGVPPAQFVALVVASRMIESLSHANLRVHFGRVGEYLLVSPRFHRVHHAIGLGHEGNARGCNFAILFPVWDVLFRTANVEKVFPATGIRDQIEGREYGRGFWQQQWLGLRRMFASFGER